MQTKHTNTHNYNSATTCSLHSQFHISHKQDIQTSNIWFKFRYTAKSTRSEIPINTGVFQKSCTTCICWSNVCFHTQVNKVPCSYRCSSLTVPCLTNITCRRNNAHNQATIKYITDKICSSTSNNMQRF